MSRQGLKVLDVLVGDVFERRRKADMRNIEIPNIDPSKAFVVMSIQPQGRPWGSLKLSQSFLQSFKFLDKPHFTSCIHQIHRLHATNDRTCITEQRFPLKMQSMDDGTHHGTSWKHRQRLIARSALSTTESGEGGGQGVNLAEVFNFAWIGFGGNFSENSEPIDFRN